MRAKFDEVTRTVFQHTAARRRLHKIEVVCRMAIHLFQHTAARRRLHFLYLRQKKIVLFQHTAARRRLHFLYLRQKKNVLFQHTAARRRLHERFNTRFRVKLVSTHSRPKAAASSSTSINSLQKCFNTQPPEGGCSHNGFSDYVTIRFNTQPPEGGCMRSLI